MTAAQVTPAGVIPIVVTPFEPDGAVDYDQFDSELAFLRGCGTVLIAFGFGSEVPRLSPDELAALVSRAAQGGSKVVGNAEVTSVPAGLASVARVAEAGAAFAMVRPSGMAGVPERAVLDMLMDVASRAVVPLVVQDAPQNTGAMLSSAGLAELLGHPGIAAVKVEPQSSAPKIGAIFDAIQDHEVRGSILGGLGGQDVVHELQRGAVGTMPGPAFPEVFQAIVSCHEVGDDGGAFDLLARVLPLINLGQRDGESFLTIQKHILTVRGVLNGHHLRGPHPLVDPKLIAETDAVIKQVELMELIDECAPE